MISLVFIICTNTGCITVAPEELFPTPRICEAAAYMLIQNNLDNPNLPPHNASFKCVSWGEPA
jgi:hypothetical protein